MSVTIDFAFNAPGELAEVRSMINAAVGVDLQTSGGDGGVLSCRLLGLELSLRECHLVDDRDLNFSRFGFLLSTRVTAAEISLLAYQVEVTALAVHALFLRGTVWEGILTYDVQTLIARYTAGTEGGVNDDLSGEAVSFPGHLTTLRARVP